MGFGMHHGVTNTPWGGKSVKGKGIKEGGGVTILVGLRNSGALKAMAGEACLPAPLCGPSSPSVHATTREGEEERGAVEGGGGIRL